MDEDSPGTSSRNIADDLLSAIDRAAAGTDGRSVTWLYRCGERTAIVPAGLAEYALAHGWGKS